jgi:hypothetical protein
MEVHINMTFKEKGFEYGRVPSFWVIGMHPGAMRKNFRNGFYWLELIEDKNILPIGHLMERAFKLNQLVVFKKPDEYTQKLIQANLGRSRMDASINVSIKTRSRDIIWVGRYDFGFFIERMLANQFDEDGNKWETLQLKILEGTENIALDE